ncbi:tetratricopeptide repeat protein [Dyadobacter jejuensis]|uniref:Tetratricopeptide repeat protein n=1 Tax=Dyadobacter jejuensis TaxID=1082580 RepID=A0A316B495_9BACT|nr:tetratricopeptide repeat protein [Dyadobacter jejuensis]PWJ57407.1 tetratricopeptide repeat protein [Dyadobacter jejuensis]
MNSRTTRHHRLALAIHLLFWWPLCFFSFVATAETADPVSVRFTPELQKAYFEIQKLRLDTARELLKQARSQDANNAFITYLDNYADLHYLLITEDRKAYKSLLSQEDQRLEQLGQLPDTSPYKRFFQAEVRVHWAFAKMKFGNEIQGAWEVIKAYKLLEENRKLFPDFRPTLKTLGLLHILIGSVPDQYSWVTRMLGLSGNIANGLEELRLVIRTEPLFRQEAQLIHILIHAYTLSLPDHLLQQLLTMADDQPDNLLLSFFATTTLMKEAKGAQASRYLYKAPQTAAYIPFPFLDYLKGELSLQQGKYAQAHGYYSQFLKRYKGFNYIKDSNFKLFFCSWVLNKEDQAMTYLSRIGSQGTTVVEADKAALRMAKEFEAHPLDPEQKLLYQARYASDGGYFQEALSFLAQRPESALQVQAHRVEWNYRKGRILQKQDQLNAAIPFLMRAISLASDQSAGLAATSALQLGYIYQSKNDTEKAIQYFKKALTYKKHDYKNSVDNKARAALTALQK